MGETEAFMPKVLVVDANVKHCLLYRMEMEAQGFEVVCAHNGSEALQQIQHRSFDVAVVDVVLPDVNGADLLKEISTNRHSDGRNLPIIINTAYPYRKSHIRHLAADAFVLKSSDLHELMGKITSLSQVHHRKHSKMPASARRLQK
jgi:DNA-binding response OmpR family regulator